MNWIKASLICLLVASCIAPLCANEHKIRVALFVDKGAHARDHLLTALESAPDITFRKIDGEELREGELDEFDLLLVPGGSAKKESLSMKAVGREEVRRFVSRGGLYLGICAGCYLLTEAAHTDLGLLPLTTRDRTHWQRGKHILPVELTPLGMEIFGTKESHFEILYHNGPVIDDSRITLESDYHVLGHYRGEIVAPGGKHGVMINSPSMFLGKFGKGLVIGISPHPEANPNQVNMEMNAIRWLYAHRHKK